LSCSGNLSSETYITDDIMPMYVDRDGLVGIETRYSLGIPATKFLWGKDFPHSSRPTLGTTQPPIEWVPGISRWVKWLSSAELKERKSFSFPQW